ncbi:MAG: ankyrin repeat domain-containing protein [Verrucomicrobiota bacterium]
MRRFLFPLWTLFLGLLTSCQEEVSLSEEAVLDLEGRGIVPNYEAMQAAARYGQDELLDLLLVAGAPQWREEGWGETPLSLALRFREASVVRRLLREPEAPVEVATPDGWFPVGLALRHQDRRQVEELIAAGADPLVASVEGPSLLEGALLAADWDFAEWLLELGADPNRPDGLGRLAYDLAYQSEAEEAFLLGLIERGARPALTSGGWERALNEALRAGRMSLAWEALQQGADPDGKGLEPPLWVALEAGQVDFVKRLLRAGADPFFAGRVSLPPVAVLLDLNRPELLPTFLQAGVPMDAPDEAGLRPLQYAAQVGDWALVDYLLEAGAEVNPTWEGELAPIRLAAESENEALVERLVDRGADPAFLSANSAEHALLEAVWARKHFRVHALLSVGASPNAEDAYGVPVLFTAVALREKSIVRKLLEAGANVESYLPSRVAKEWRDLIGDRHLNFYLRNGDSRITPLMVAASTGDDRLVQLLLDYGASKNRYTRNYKRYPIHFASEQGHIRCMQVLLGKDPDQERDVIHIEIDLSEQRAVLFKDGVPQLTSRVSTGKRGHGTPTGEFVITNRHRHWTSTIYGSSMPYFMRLSCSAFGMHYGYVPNYPASHGCIRMPMKNVREFWGVADRGTRVIIRK